MNGVFIASIRKAVLLSFRKFFANVSNPYGGDRTAPRIVGLLKKHAGRIPVIKKSFYDVPATRTPRAR